MSAYYSFKQAIIFVTTTSETMKTGLKLQCLQLSFSSHSHSCTCHRDSIFYSSSSQRAVFWDGAFKWMREVSRRVPRCPAAAVKGSLSHRQGGQRSAPALLSFTAAEERFWQPVLPSCAGARPVKPQADNECHTIMTTCTFMERGGRTLVLRAYDGASSINQTIRERAEKHLWNLWWEPQLIYCHYWKRSVSKWMCLEVNCGDSRRNTTFQMRPRHLQMMNHGCIIHDLPFFPEPNKPHAIYEESPPK